MSLREGDDIPPIGWGKTQPADKKFPAGASPRRRGKNRTSQEEEREMDADVPHHCVKIVASRSVLTVLTVILRSPTLPSDHGLEIVVDRFVLVLELGPTRPITVFPRF
jgi:hypothetical protein